MRTFPELHSERLILSELTSQDIPKIVEHAGNINVSRHTLNMPHPYTREDAVSFIITSHQQFQDGKAVILAIRKREERELIGGIGLYINQRHNHAELGYWMAELFWNQGYMSEAVGKMLEYGFNHLNLHKIYAHHKIDNPASGKVMIKNGMIKEGELVDHIRKDGAYITMIQYRLTAHEYAKLQ